MFPREARSESAGIAVQAGEYLLQLLFCGGMHVCKCPRFRSDEYDWSGANWSHGKGSSQFGSGDGISSGQIEG